VAAEVAEDVRDLEVLADHEEARDEREQRGVDRPVLGSGTVDTGWRAGRRRSIPGDARNPA
jgi:hypothetical protein